MNQVAKPHIFVLGAARSGTKLVRDVLGSAEDLSVVPYDVNYIWRKPCPDHPDDCLPIEALQNTSKADWIKKTLDKSAEGSADRFIEKTVSNTLRPDYVHALYPDAYFVVLIRNGEDVIESVFRQYHSSTPLSYAFKKFLSVPFAAYPYLLWYAKNTIEGRLKGQKGGDIWGPRYPGYQEDLAHDTLLSVCAKQWVSCNEKLMAYLPQIADDRKIIIRYEDFVQDPSIIDKLCDHLGVADKKAVQAAYQTTVRPNQDRGWYDNLTKIQRENVLKIIDDLQAKLGYR